MLPAGGSCLLGSINLAEFATSHGFNFDDFRKTVHIATIGLNEVLDKGLPLHILNVNSVIKFIIMVEVLL